MSVNVKLFAGLSEFLPPGSTQNSAQVQATEGLTINQIIGRFNVPVSRVQLVLLNGVYVKPGDRDCIVPNHGDTLAMWPPVAGG